MVAASGDIAELVELHDVSLDHLNKNFSPYLFTRVAGLRELASHIAREHPKLGKNWLTIRNKARGFMDDIPSIEAVCLDLWPKGDFTSTTDAQFNSAFEGEPLRLDKALVITLALWLFVEDKKLDVNFKAWVRIRPAIYVIEGLNTAYLHLLEEHCPRIFKGLNRMLRRMSLLSYKGEQSVPGNAAKAQLISVAQQQPFTHFTTSLIYKFLQANDAHHGLSVRSVKNRPEITKLTGRKACSTTERLCVLVDEKRKRPTFNQAEYLALAAAQ